MVGGDVTPDLVLWPGSIFSVVAEAGYSAVRATNDNERLIRLADVTPSLRARDAKKEEQDTSHASGPWDEG